MTLNGYDSWLQPPDPVFCATHGEDCEADPMDSCPEFDGDDCSYCGPRCHCDEDYEASKEDRISDYFD
jgi:hypothetical protein